MKRVALIVLAAALLGFTGVAWAGGGHGDDCDHYHGYRYSHASRYYAACPPGDMRVKIAEAEKLKASFYYYSLSCTPCDAATAKYMGAELDAVLAEINAWYCNIR